MARTVAPTHEKEERDRYDGRLAAVGRHVTEDSDHSITMSFLGKSERHLAELLEIRMLSVISMPQSPYQRPDMKWKVIPGRSSV